MDRVFPVNNQPLDGSEKELNLISAETVAAKLAEAKTQENRLSAEVLDMIRTAKKGEDEKKEEKKDSGKKGKIPPQLLPYIKKKKGTEDKDVDTDDEECENKAGPRVVRSKEPVKKANSRMRKIYFASADQISAEAAKAALDSGDDALHQAIISARHDRRVAVASQILEAHRSNAEVQEKLAKRNQYRMNLVAEAEKAEKFQKTASASKTALPATRDFKKPVDFTPAERSAFMKVASAYNFPKEYVESQFAALIEPETVTHIKSVMASKLDDTTKRATITAMVKTAELDDANVNRLLRYWKDELGYQDDQWVDHLFKTKYDTQRAAEASSEKNKIVC